MKRVSVQFKDQESRVYEGVSRIEEERHYEHVVALRLYDRDGDLMAILDRGQIANLDVSEQS